MRRRWHLFRIFLFFFILALIIFFLAQRQLLDGVTGFFEGMTLPIQRMTYGNLHSEKKTPEEVLKQENNDLRSQLSHLKEIESENQALHDQFKTEQIASKKLLPSHIVGTGDDEILIDKGSDDGVKVNDSIVVKNNLVGKIIKSSVHVSVVGLITKKGVTYAAQDQQTSALGVGRGEGNGGIILDVVELSDTLSKNDLVITKGDRDEKGNGFEPNLVIGKIISINKKSSSIFQSADVESLVDISKLNMVFVMSE